MTGSGKNMRYHLLRDLERLNPSRHFILEDLRKASPKRDEMLYERGEGHTT